MFDVRRCPIICNIEKKTRMQMTFFSLTKVVEFETETNVVNSKVPTLRIWRVKEML